MRVRKRTRLALRLAVSVILITLSLADSLNSLTLISTTTALIVLVLAVDLYGSTNCDEPFWKCKRQCQYSTECPLKRNILLDALKRGERVKLNEVQVGGGDTDGLVGEGHV